MYIVKRMSLCYIILDSFDAVKIILKYTRNTYNEIKINLKMK